VLASLRRQRLRLVGRLRDGDIDCETGERLVGTVRALDRATDAFGSFDEPSFEERTRRERIGSARGPVDLMREFGEL